MNENLCEIAKANAKNKLAVIIERFGDENGRRLTESYLNQLVEEELRALQFSEATFSIFTEKRSVTMHISTPSPV